MPTFGQKTSILSKIHIMDQKSQQDVLFYQFFTKKLLPNAHIYFQKEKRPFSKNTLLSCPYFVEKTSILSETLCSYINKKKHEKPPGVMPIFDQKTSILSKQHYIMSQRSQQDALFFRFLTKKSSLLCPYFVKKRPFSKKHTALKSIF